MNTHPNKPPVALRSIALFEIAKGLLAVAAACGLLSLRNTDLHAAADTFLLRHGIDPETHYTRLLIESVAKATQLPIAQAVSFALAYALIRFAEGFGLWRGKSWAEWFAVISAGLYLPLEIRLFTDHPTVFTAVVIVLNGAIMVYLGKLLLERRAATPRMAADTIISGKNRQPAETS